MKECFERFFISFFTCENVNRGMKEFHASNKISLRRFHVFVSTNNFSIILTTDKSQIIEQRLKRFLTFLTRNRITESLCVGVNVVASSRKTIKLVVEQIVLFKNIISRSHSLADSAPYKSVWLFFSRLLDFKTVVKNENEVFYFFVLSNQIKSFLYLV